MVSEFLLAFEFDNCIIASLSLFLNLLSDSKKNYKKTNFISTLVVAGRIPFASISVES